MLLAERIPDWRFIVAALVTTRVTLTAVGLAAMALLPPYRQQNLLPDVPWLSMWAQWDAFHYVTIAVHGYSPPSEPYSNVVFFPLYPWLIQVVAAPFGPLTEQGAALAGLFVSNVALFVGLLYLAALVARDFGLSTSRRTVLYMLLFPTTLFLSSVFAESLFLATGAASLYHARAGQWYRAGLAGGLAAMTRPFGILLVVPLAIELLRQRPGLRVWPSLVLVPAGLAVFFGYLWSQFNDPLAYMTGGRSWGRGFHWPWEPLAGYLTEPPTLFDWPYALVDFAAMAAMVALAIVAWRVLPASYAAYSTAGVLFALTSGIAWFSAPRHALALFPLIVVLAVLGERPAVNRAWLIFSVAVAVAFMARVAVGYWVS